MEAFPVAETLDFESMLAEVSAALLSAPVDSFHEELESAIDRIRAERELRASLSESGSRAAGTLPSASG
jgi:hypothetical protein